MNQTFLDVLAHEGPVTIVTVNGNPAHVVNTWASYVTVLDGDRLLIPAGGMHSIEDDAATDNRVTLTFGSKDVIGTQGPGAGFHVHGRAEFLAAGPDYDQKKAQFPWLSRVLVVHIDDIEQKI